MKQIDIGWQYTLDGGSVAITRLKFDRPIAELKQLVADSRVKCDECWEPVRKGSRGSIDLEVWDRPFDESSRTITLHHDPTYSRYGVCSERIYDGSWGDFRYFECSGCNRIVCEQNPSNGWHTQYRIIDEYDQICLKCYSEHVLEYGIDRESVENGQLSGMFFSHGNPEPREAGYEPLGDRFIRSTDSANAVCREVLALMDSGYQVVIGYESMAIGALEGTVSLHRKAMEYKQEEANN